MFLVLIMTNTLSYANNKTLYASVPAFPPFNGFVESKHCAGVNMLAIQAVIEGLPVNIEFSSYPYARILHSLKTGELDLALILKNSGLKKNVVYIGPLSYIKIVLVTPSNITIERYEDLHQLKNIAVIRNTQFNKIFDQDKKLKKIKVDNYKQAVSLLKMNRIDGIIGSKIGLEYSLRLQGMDSSLVTNTFDLDRHELGLHLAKKSPFITLQPLLTAAVERLYQEDFLYQIYQYQINHCLPSKGKSHAGN